MSDFTIINSKLERHVLWYKTKNKVLSCCGKKFLISSINILCGDERIVSCNKCLNSFLRTDKIKYNYNFTRLVQSHIVYSKKYKYLYYIKKYSDFVSSKPL